MPRKIRDLKADLIRLGFAERNGKGSHRNWKHPRLRFIITIAFEDGDDVPRYLEQLLKRAIRELESNS
ncbi:MAG: type II toxin-antitoxin system HicA family toxin [Cyanobacteria bacterium RU_5_0]|nr:type II toxin-antitoxin system HicA family toxin [Cyanobacteria bacterium RU_5_0]